jgi:hypothetical protein
VPWIGAVLGYRFAGGNVRFSFNEVVMALQSDLSEAAQRNRWQYVGGLLNGSSRSGYCSSSRRWFNTISDSQFKQGTYDGAMHPNVYGHFNAAILIANSIPKSLL